MRLTLMLMKHPRLRNVNIGRLRKHIGGAIDIGKHKIFEPICPWDKHAAMNHLIEDQRNLEVLARPYITPEQERGAKAEFLGLTEKELLDEVEWKANFERINRGAKRFHMKSLLWPAPWIVKKEYMDRMGVQKMKDHKKLDDQLKKLEDSRFWE